jgi:formate hydrogenlyase subunit 3/multisubunit Na+/H+ antiporter MnhD subunit
MTDIQFVPIFVLALVVYTLMNLLKYLRARDWNAVITLVGGWVVGFLAVWLVGATTWGSTVTVGGTKTLDQLSFPEILLVGLVVVSVGSAVYDLKKSFDNTDSAATPTLLPPPKGTPNP